MQLYVSDFVGDTLLLSTEHIGAYLLLLIALWNADGQLPADDVKLARVARMTVKKWRSVQADLMPFFIVESDMLTHGRLTKEIQKSERQRELRAYAGAKGGAANALKNKTRGQASAVAGLKHVRALPEPYKKEGNLILVGEESEAGFLIDRILEADLFEACEEVTGQKVPTFLQQKRFHADVVAKARAKAAA